jgi:hypothetical protein
MTTLVKENDSKPRMMPTSESGTCPSRAVRTIMSTTVTNMAAVNSTVERSKTQFRLVTTFSFNGNT